MATSSSDSPGMARSTIPAWAASSAVHRRRRHDRLVHRGKRRAGLQDGDHAGVERQAHVGLGHAPVAAADPHQPQVVRDRELRAGTEGMAVHGGDRVARQREHAADETQDVLQEGESALWSLRHHRGEIQAVRVELLGARGDEGERWIAAHDLVEPGVHRRDEVRVEAVLPVVHGEHEHRSLTTQVDHRRRRITSPAGHASPAG